MIGYLGHIINKHLMDNDDNMEGCYLSGDTFDLYLDKRGFYHLYIKPGEEFTMTDYIQIYKFLESDFHRKRAPFLIEFGYGCSFAEGIYEVVATGRNRFSTADAFLIETYAHNLIVKYYLKTQNPITPAHIFHSKDDALSWMAQYQK